MTFRRSMLRKILALSAGIFLFVSQASAATLTSRSLTLERMEPSVASNQQIRFTTPTGVTVASQTMVLHYPTGFNLTSVTFGDIDLFYGPTTGLETSATLAAAPGVGIWGVAISGQNITFTAPTNVGPVSAGDKVIIRIGTNASGGTNRIVNPGDGGAPVFLVVDGSFGDTGGFDVPIYSGTTISVSATVGTTTTPPVPGPGGSDGTPPTIFNVQVINITTSTATITWQTDEPANGVVQYGLTNAYGAVASHASYISSHQIDLTGLTASTTYHFRINSVDPTGNSASTGDQTFNTSPIPHPPIISNLQIVSITDTSAIVTWQTDIPANSTVDYGLTTSYGSSISDAAFVTNHSVSLTGLSPATLYHLRVTSAEPTGFSSQSSDTTFTTLSDTTPPTNVFNFTATPGNAQNDLQWTNPSDADFAYVRIRARTDGYPTSPTDGRLVYQGTAQNVTDTGLINGTTYYYTNFAFDFTGNPSSGAIAQATPSALIPPPVPPVPPPTTPTTTPPTRPPGAATTTPPTPPVLPPGVATTTPPLAPGIVIAPQYYGGNGTVELSQDASGVVTSLAGRSLLVRVSTVGIGRIPVSAMVTVDGGRYALTPVGAGDVWAASFVPSNQVERLRSTVEFQFDDGSVAQAVTIIQVVGGGRVLSREGLSPIPQPKSGAEVTLYEMTVSGWRVWNGQAYGQANPIMTSANGGYGYVVRNGSYRLVVKAEDYQTQERLLDVRNNVLGVDVIMPHVVTLPVIGAIATVIQSPEVQEAATVIAPVVVAVALANLALATSLVSVFNYLYFLFTQPFLLFGRKKRQRWGIVYNSLSKMPVDLVAVRLIHAKTNLILQTRITDAKGRFSFRVRPGQYRVEVSRQGYSYPSQFIKNQAEDGDFVDLYHGEIIDVKEEVTLAVNIPIDPQVKEETPSKIIWKKRFRAFQVFLSLTSLFVTIGALAIAPSWILLGLAVFQIFTFILFRRLAKPKKPKGWGIVYDNKTRRPIGQTVVRIFDRKFNKLLETQVTDNRGTYGFYAQKNVYFVTAEKPGFEKYKSEDIDLTKKDVAVIDKHIDMKKSG